MRFWLKKREISLKGQTVAAGACWAAAAAVLLAVMAAAWLVFWYTDIGDTLDNAVMLVESIAGGDLRHFYEYASKNASPATVYPANYELPIYLVFALWNLPVALRHMDTGFDYMKSARALLWCKLLVFLCLIAVALLIYRLCRRVLGGTVQQGLLGAFLFLSSASVFLSAMVAVQYDCIMLLLVLLGLVFYFSEKRGSLLLFLLCFGLAIPMKSFALLLFLPIVLVREKRIWSILAQTAAVLLPSVLCKALFASDYYYTLALSTQNIDAVNVLLNSTVALGNVRFNPFLIGYVLLLVWCYLYDNPKQQNYTVLYLCFAVLRFLRDSFCSSRSVPTGLFSTRRFSRSFWPPVNSIAL